MRRTDKQGRVWNSVLTCLRCLLRQSNGYCHGVLEEDPFIGWENELDNQEVPFKSSVCMSPKPQRKGSVIIVIKVQRSKSSLKHAMNKEKEI